MTKTGLIVTIGVITLGIYDLAAVTFGGVDASVSRFLLGSAMIAPLIPFCFGFISGHLFGKLYLVCDTCKKKLNEKDI